jgi:hypothetical protein
VNVVEDSDVALERQRLESQDPSMMTDTVILKNLQRVVGTTFTPAYTHKTKYEG